MPIPEKRFASGAELFLDRRMKTEIFEIRFKKPLTHVAVTINFRYRHEPLVFKADRVYLDSGVLVMESGGGEVCWVDVREIAAFSHKPI